MPTERITFPGAQGDTLAARLDLPDGTPKAYALFAHCFTCTKDIFAAAQIARALAAQGVAVLRFDFTGLGHSDGEFANTTFSSNVADLVAAAKYLAEVHTAPTIIVGHSLGGAAVLAAAPQIDSIRAVATIGAPADPHHVTHLFADARAEIETTGSAEVTLAGRPFTITRDFINDTAEAKLTKAIAASRLPLLVMHAPTDDTVGIDNAGTIFGAAKHPKSFVSLDDADHLLTRKADAIYAADVLAAWAARYVPGLNQPADTAPGAAPRGDGEVVVSSAGTGKFAHIVRVGRHRLRADEPPSVGGDDTGPTPYGFLLAALGACTAMTLRMYADFKKLPLRDVTVRLRHEKVHAADAAEGKGGKIDQIDMSLELAGDLDAATRERMLEIASRCPVHQTLKRENVITTNLVSL